MTLRRVLSRVQVAAESKRRAKTSRPLSIVHGSTVAVEALAAIWTDDVSLSALCSSRVSWRSFSSDGDFLTAPMNLWHTDSAGAKPLQSLLPPSTKPAIATAILRVVVSRPSPSPWSHRDLQRHTIRFHHHHRQHCARHHRDARPPPALPCFVATIHAFA